MTLQVIFYGCCGPSNDQGIIAIDDVLLLSKSPVTSTNQFLSNFTSLVATGETLKHSSSVRSETTQTVSIPLATDVETSSIPSVIPCDFYPCECISTDNRTESDVSCPLIPTKQLRDEVFAKFENYSRKLGMFYIYPPPNDSILFDMFATTVTYINWFEIYCTHIEDDYYVDPLAFIPNIIVSYLYFEDCNFVSLNFLSQFSEVGELWFRNTSNFQDVLKTLPENLKINVLRIDQSYFIDLASDDFPRRSTGFTELRVWDNQQCTDEIIDMFYNWALGTSRDTLLKLYIFNNSLTKIPPGLSRFNRLAYFRIDNNILEPAIVRNGDLAFSDYTIGAGLSKCGIHTIEAGAFQGEKVKKNINMIYLSLFTLWNQHRGL